VRFSGHKELGYRLAIGIQKLRRHAPIDSIACFWKKVIHEIQKMGFHNLFPRTIVIIASLFLLRLCHENCPFSVCNHKSRGKQPRRSQCNTALPTGDLARQDTLLLLLRI
jgi:hypothetical protein